MRDPKHGPKWEAGEGHGAPPRRFTYCEFNAETWDSAGTRPQLESGTHIQFRDGVLVTARVNPFNGVQDVQHGCGMTPQGGASDTTPVPGPKAQR